MWESHLPLLCNHVPCWSPQTCLPLEDKAPDFSQSPTSRGRLEVGLNGSQGRDEPMGDQRVPRVGSKMAPTTGLGTRRTRRSARGLVPGLLGDVLSPMEWYPVFWELGSWGWVFRVFCNYFPFVLPWCLVKPFVEMPAGLSCAKSGDKGGLCAGLALCFSGGPSKVKDQPGHEEALEVSARIMCPDSLWMQIPSRLFQAPLETVSFTES